MTTLQDSSVASTSLIEHQVLHHIKAALRVTLDWDAPVVSVPRKLSSLQFTMKSFRRHLERVMALEEEGGYLDDVASEKPNLYSRIELLIRDHDRLRTTTCDLVPRLEGLQDWQEDEFEVIRQEIRELLSEVDEHDAREIGLLQEAMLIDDGGEG